MTTKVDPGFVLAAKLTTCAVDRAVQPLSWDDTTVAGLARHPGGVTP